MTASGKYTIGFDLGGTKMMAALCDRDYRIVAREKKKTRPENGQDECFARMVTCVEELLEKSGVTADEIAALGVGAPGPLDHVNGVIRQTPNLGWSDFPIRDKFERELGIRTFLDNDVNLGTLGEFVFGAGKGGTNAIGIFVGTGIGGGLIIDGRLYHGHSGMAGEIGHMIVESDGFPCGCGGNGCLETVASRSIVSAVAWLMSLRGDAPHLLAETREAGEPIKSGALARAIKNGDGRVRELVEYAARRIGEAVATLVNVLSPDTVILGGGLVEAMPDVIVPEIKKTLDKKALRLLMEGVRVVAAELGDDAVAMGAAHMAQNGLSGSGGK